MKAQRERAISHWEAQQAKRIAASKDINEHSPQALDSHRVQRQSSGEAVKKVLNRGGRLLSVRAATLISGNFLLIGGRKEASGGCPHGRSGRLKDSVGALVLRNSRTETVDLPRRRVQDGG